MSERPKVATVLFDEAHSEAWTVRPDVAAAIQPAHPGDSSLVRAAEALATREFDVAVHADGPLSTQALAPPPVLFTPPPSAQRGEPPAAGGPPRLSSDEIDAIERFVADGGG